MAAKTDNLYVTFVDIDHDLLKIWGQRNRIGATYIERQLLQLTPEFNRTPSPNPSRITKGIFCFAKYTDDNYYRARVVSNIQGDLVRVLFIDYGNRDFINVSNIRIQDGNEGDVLAKMAEQAEEYYLARISAPSFGWTKEIVSEIRRDICYEEFPYRLADQVGDQKILEIQFHNEDYSQYLVKMQIARPLTITLQKQMILSYCSLVSNDFKRDTQVTEIPKRNVSAEHSAGPKPPFKPPIDGQQPVHFSFPSPTHYVPSEYSNSRHVNQSPQQIHKNSPQNIYLPSRSQFRQNTANNPAPLNMNQVLCDQYNSLYQAKGPAPAPHFNTVIEALALQVKQYIAQDNAKADSEAEKIPHTYINNVLEVGTTYNVFVSYIDDGPWSFSIQLVSSEAKLEKLIDELASCDLIPLKPPIILGHPCIASSEFYKTLCRGVVVSISHSAVKVYFVDFGNTEDLPSSAIYELPPKLFKTRVLSQKFSLSGLQKVAYSDDIKKFFQEVVHDELLMLRVTSLEDDNLPTCELYLKDTNIKRILNEKIRESRNLTQEEYPKPGDVENVVVTWVVSPQKFFVQLCKRESDMNFLKNELAEVETKGQPLVFQQLCVGLRCVCLYEADQQWYRAVITSIDSENEITVFYVDYGNTEVVRMSMLRKINGSGLINRMNVQGIQCSLKGFESQPFNQDIASKLESMILEKNLQMTVISCERGFLSVQLFENGKDISTLLLASMPKINISQKSADQAPIDTDWKSSSTENDRASSPQPRSKNKFSENVASFQKKDVNHRNRAKRHISPHFGETKSSKSQFRLKKGSEESDWRSGQSDNNFSLGRGGRETNDKENDRDGQRSWRSRGGFNQEEESWKEGERKDNNFGERRKFEGMKQWNGSSKMTTDLKRKFGERTDRFERLVRQDSSESRRSSSGDSRSARRPIRKEDAAPPGSKYEEIVINVGTTERGIVTYYFSPHEFFVQLLRQEEEFKQMMSDMQVYYKDKYSTKDPLEAGDIVVAQFSLDKVLYRAQVVKPSPVTVVYVDYGNQEPVGPRTTWLVDKQFLKLPKQVIRCRLANIEPLGSYWPPPGSEIDKFFEFENYNCTFVSVQDDVYEISMEIAENGKDVATEIIAAGLAQPAVPKMTIPKIDYSLLPNQVLRLYLSHVESSSKFYVVVNPKAVELIEEDLRVYVEVEKKLKPLGKSSIKPEACCLSTKDDVSWHRGVITKVEGNQVSVWFSDRGDSVEVTENKVMSLPGYLKVFQPQAVECFLHGDLVNEENFKETVSDSYFLVSIISATDQRLGVVLYGEEGQRPQFLESDDSPQAIEPIGQLPIFYQKVPLALSHMESPKEVYIQLMADADILNRLSEELTEFYEEDKKEFRAEEEGEGTLLAVKSVVYETWYRGRLLSVDEDGLEVFYIDYGNKEVLPRENVRKLDASFLSWNACSRRVSFDLDWKPDDVETVRDKILDLTRDKDLEGYFVNKDGELVVEVTFDEARLTESIAAEGLASLSGEDKFKELLPSKQRTGSVVEVADPGEPPSYKKVLRNVLPEGLKVLVSHIDSPNKFWVHAEGAIDELSEIHEKLQNTCENLPEKDVLQVGDIVAILFLNMWYRVKVLKVKDDLSLQLLDYGKVITANMNSSVIKELPPELASPPPFATCYSLKGTWDESKTFQFEDIIMQSEELVNLVVLEEGDPVVVDLLQNGQSVTEKLMLEPFEESEGDLCTVYISHADSPEDFYVQRETSAESFNGITDRLREAETFEEASAVQENEVYAAKFPEDEAWYRVRILEKLPDGSHQVFFIDFGNVAKVTEIRCLPSDLLEENCPSVGENCSLLYGNTCDAWSPAACEKFLEMCYSAPFKMKTVVGRVKKPIVKLFRENKSVSAELAALCENDGRFEAYVSYAVSPNDFYIQRVEDENYTLVAKKLEAGDESPELEERQPGSLCQALFEDDGLWYRGKMLRDLDEGCEVFFIDFGNVSVTKKVKKLPPEIEDIPAMALRCSLELPERNVTESVKEEFVNLIAGGAAVFRARILTPGEVNVVSLKLDGRILEETLLVDAISQENVEFPPGENRPRLDDETDDGKNSKKNLLGETYFASNLEDDAKAESSICNETDEEKRVKIAISGGEEGFKSDDEKGITEGRVLSGVVNATDNELIEESVEVEGEGEEEEDEDEEEEKEEEEEGGEVETGDKVNGEEVAEDDWTTNEEIQENGESGHDSTATDIFVVEEEKEEDDSEIVSSQNKTEKTNEKYNNQKRNKVHKIVPGSISRGDCENGQKEASVSPRSYSKINYSEKLVPGGISRGVSMEAVSSESESAAEARREERQVSRSAPNTPRCDRRKDGKGYVKMDRNDRVVPGCIAGGIAFACTSELVEKLPPSEKIVSGSVNGSGTEK